MSKAERNQQMEQKSEGITTKTVGTAIERAKAKNARLRLMKERNENYLAEHRDERLGAEELTGDLGGFSAGNDNS